jgi:hypothetical protein
MKPALSLAILTFLAALTSCTNYLYQGQISGLDAYGKPGRYTLYWPKTDPLIGRSKAGPAILMTDCSTTRLDFSEHPDGIFFMGEPDKDRLPGASASVGLDQRCGVLHSGLKLSDIRPGEIELMINCEPMPSDEMSVYPRNYPKAQSSPYLFRMVEKIKRWSFFGETLPGPVANCTP